MATLTFSRKFGRLCQHSELLLEIVKYAIFDLTFEVAESETCNSEEVMIQSNQLLKAGLEQGLAGGSDVNVFKDMTYEQKVVAIRDVVIKISKNELELNSGCCKAWEQATAFFLIEHGIRALQENFSSHIFEDMDFLSVNFTNYPIGKGLQRQKRLTNRTKEAFKNAGIDEGFGEPKAQPEDKDVKESLEFMRNIE